MVYKISNDYETEKKKKASMLAPGAFTYNPSYLGG
jgi:hypothetical protein